LNDNRTIEVVLDTVDQSTISKVEEDLSDLIPKRWKSTRELITVLTIASTVVTLIKTLLEIREKLAKQKDAPRMLLRNANRDEIDLASAQEDQLRAFLSAPEQ
jgi:hypothetical protein